MLSTLGPFLLILMAFLAYQYFKPPVPPTPSQPETPGQSGQSGQAGQAGQANPSGQANGGVPTAAAASTAPAVVASTESQTIVENELYRITFSNKGARAISWQLKHYRRDEQSCHSVPFLFDFAAVQRWMAGCLSGKEQLPLDLVNQDAAKAYGYPLELYTYEPALTQELNQALYQPSATGVVAAPAGIIFKYAKGPVEVTKTFEFNQGYVIDVKVAVTRNGAPVRALVAWPSGLGDQVEASQYASSKFAWSTDGKRDSSGPGHSWFANGISNGATFDQPYDYAAAIDLYFAAAFMPATPSRATVVTFNNSVQAPKDSTDPNSQKFPTSAVGVAVGDTSGVTETRLFAGPLQFDVLGSIHTFTPSGATTGEDLKPLIQFGFLKIIAEPLFLLLRLVHGWVGNWGWAIVLVTLFFNLAMLPTRLMMMKSSLKMQRVQPKMDAIKKKYAHLKPTDPKRAEMNVETMELYKQEGISMYGSCLPLLVQMPLFFAYYRVLANVVELRQAHWGWLPNLAVADPWHILPIVIIVSMFLVQFLTPAPGMDPAQRKMMAFMMPAIFGVSMWNYASGLALYWGTGNLLNLGLQLGINNSKMGRELKALAAKRAAKKSPGPPTIQGKRGK